MIDLKEYPLTYFCKQSGAEFKGKTLIQNELAELVNVETKEAEKISVYKLKKRFKSDPENKKRGQRTKTLRSKFIFGSEYEEYLESDYKYDFKTVNCKRA